MSLIFQITEYVQRRPFDWVNGGEFERLGMLEWVDEDGHHYKASNVSRRLREMSDGKTREKTLERKEINGTVYYKYIPIMQRTSHPSQVESKAEAQGVLAI